MIVIVTSSLIALLFTILDSKKVLNSGLLLSFILVTVVSAIRYDYGNDYMGYYEDFNLVTKYSIGDLFAFSDVINDVGWAILCKIFEPLGFYIFIAFLSVISSVIYYKFIKENVYRQDYWIAMFIYLFTFDFFVLQLSMIRQGLAIALFLLSYHYLKRKKILIPILLVLLAISFHKTSLIILPFLFFCKFSYVRKGGLISWCLIILFIGCLLSSSLVKDFFSSFMAIEALSIYDSKYGEETGNEIGIRMIFEFIPFFVAMYYVGSKRTNNESKYMVFLSSISTLIFPFTMIIHLISRLCFYFGVFTIATIPMTYKSVSNPIIRIVLYSIYFLVTIYIYIDRFLNSVYTDSFLNYKTIFSVL